MKSDIRQNWYKIYSNHLERLNGAIQVLVVDGVLIMVDSVARPCHFIANEENAVVTRIGLEPVADRCACPGHNGRQHPLRGANRRKCECARPAADGELAVGGIVIHVALPGILLAP